MSVATEKTDVIVIGLGAMGSAVLYQLAKQGVRAIGLDRFAPPHDRGSSHGDTRITRQAVGEGSAYVPFVLDSHAIWRELEAATGETLLTTCGVLVIGPRSGQSSHHGKPDFVARTAEVAAEHGIPHSLLDASGLRHRFPTFIGVADDALGYLEPGGGYVRPERCVAAQLRRAVELGAVVQSGSTVRTVEQVDGQVHVTTERARYHADQAIVAAGAWTGPLLGAPWTRLLTVRRQVLHWFALEADAPIDAALPVQIWMHGTGDADYFYGFPPLPGERGVKVATEQYETATTADAAWRTVAPDEAARMHERHIRGRLAGVTPHALRSTACLYTITPDHGFIIDRHPGADRVTVVAACSGHGFKHSAGIGRAVAETVVKGVSPVDLTPFALARFAV
ncbi:N-methyl-L-tryptophan oxidase [Marinivivus vitaminiproducens]|uniref:N-methyl-L-tryptophan oxidase n=1 Tax=Marinivivus vitaminiproducens TaxID=3035935 RepID=UPI0027A588A5|nr:N-methyl-L-tryptophan oxidase [Geminicoccaceae bacterium SCSIO 64248]